MKKLVYTLSFMTVLGFAANAQTKETAKPAEQQQKTAKPAESAKPAQPAESVKPVEMQVPADQPKSRMAITQKGVPASKAKEKENKDAKTVEPKGQPIPAPAEKH